MWKCILCSITLLVLSVCAEITVNKNAYEGLVIAIGDDLDEADCNSNFNLIQDMLISASELLYNATGNRLSLGEVKVVVPDSWTCDGNASRSEGIKLNDAHVRVGPSHPVFVDSPWTQQPRGCGEQGDFIYMSEGYLKSPSEIYGTTAQVFVQEWAKFRWGVFEESGHLGDALFPPSYQTILNDTLTMLPNYCTDQEILGDQSCTNNTAEKDCLFTPSTTGSNDGITSSLLSVPFLKNVVHFCNSSTHNDNVPSKHNFLCDGKSAWDVITESTDISDTISSKDNPAVPTIKLLKATSPFSERIVIAMEHSQDTGQVKDTWEFLRDTVRQFIQVKFNSEAEVGLITFNSAAKILANLTVLSSSVERNTLSSMVPKEKSDSTATKNLVDAISKAASILNSDGVIILMTANPQNTVANANNLISAAGGNSVWPLLYPHKDGISTSVYEALANSTGGHVYTIINETHKPTGFFFDAQNVNNYHDLSLKMLQIKSSISSTQELIEINTQECDMQTKDCSVTLTVDEPLLYDNEYIIETYSATNDAPTINDNSNIEVIADIDTYKAYKIEREMSNSFSMTVSRDGMGDIIRVALMAKKIMESSDYSVTVSASPSLENLQYTNNTVPVIYAQIAKDWDLVVFANVIAMVESSNISLHDNGIGADVTGNDGIYSAYLLGVSNIGKADITFSIDDNNGNAKIMQVQTKAVPSNLNRKWCCGSNIDLSDVQLVPAVNLSVISTVVSGNVMGDPVNQNLPPGRVTDLSVAVEGITNDNDKAQITLNFTATGDELDQGIVSYYKLRSDPSDDLNSRCENENAEPGTSIICSFYIIIPPSGTLYTYSLVAVNGKSIEGKPSNKVRIFVSTETIVVPETRTPLTGGAIAGIVIGVLLFIILVVLGVLLFLGKDEKEDSLAWNIVCCKCCKKEEEDNIYNKDPPTSARSNDVTRNPTVEPIRSIEDLYAKPDMDAKKRNQAEKIKDDHDDGGFTTHRSRSNDIPLQTNYSVNNTLERGSQQNLPINQVGIPIAENPSLQRNQPYDRNTYNQRHNPNQDYRGVNNGYDASSDYGTNNSQPQTGRAPRTLTQV